MQIIPRYPYTKSKIKYQNNNLCLSGLIRRKNDLHIGNRFEFEIADEATAASGILLEYITKGSIITDGDAKIHIIIISQKYVTVL